jgi:hypothetical protein
MLAYDRSRWPHRSPLGHLRLAYDRSSVRSYSPDGHLHISDAALSKAEVNAYTGAELAPNLRAGVRLDLDPQRRYSVLRPPDELRRAAPTFNSLPVLWGHRPLDADHHPADIVVGATGSDALFITPWLRNSLVVWTSLATDAIEAGTDNLSAGYHYIALPEPGIFNGRRYQFIMRNIIGNHIAVVDQGRVPGAVIGDSLPVVQPYRQFAGRRQWTI